MCCFRDQLPAHVRDCVQLYTADWVVVNYQYRHLSSSTWVRDRGCERHNLVQAIPRQVFEVDHDHLVYDDCTEDEGYKVLIMFDCFGIMCIMC